MQFSSYIAYPRACNLPTVNIPHHRGEVMSLTSPAAGLGDVREKEPRKLNCRVVHGCWGPWDLPDPGIKPTLPARQVDSLPLSHVGSPVPRMMIVLLILPTTPVVLLFLTVCTIH